MGISLFARPTPSANARTRLVLALRELERRVCEHRYGLALEGELEDRHSEVAEVLIPELDAPDDHRVGCKSRKIGSRVAGTHDRGVLVASCGLQSVVHAACL